MFQMPLNSAALPITEYRAITECGRIFSWSSTSAASVFYEIKRDKGLSVVLVEPFSLAEEECLKQLELHAEHEGDTAA